MTDRGPYGHEDSLSEVLLRLLLRLGCAIRGGHSYDSSCGNMGRTRVYHRCSRCSYVMSTPYPPEAK